MPIRRSVRWRYALGADPLAVAVALAPKRRRFSHDGSSWPLRRLSIQRVALQAALPVFRSHGGRSMAGPCTASVLFRRTTRSPCRPAGLCRPIPAAASIPRYRRCLPACATLPRWCGLPRYAVAASDNSCCKDGCATLLRPKCFCHIAIPKDSLPSRRIALRPPHSGRASFPLVFRPGTG